MKGQTRILSILLLVLIGFALGRMTHRRGPEPTIITTVDSTSTIDSNVVTKPEIKDSTVIHHIYVKLPVVQDPADSVPASQVSVPASQTSDPADSVLVDIPIEGKVYQEDSLYRAVISGYRCNLDSLTIFNTTTTITIHEKEIKPAPKWSFGVTVGPSVLVTPSGSVKAGLGATVGATYRF